MELELLERNSEKEKREHEKRKIEKEKLKRKKYEEDMRNKDKEREDRASNLQKELAIATERDGSPGYQWETQASDWLDQQVKQVNTKLRKEDLKKKKKQGGAKGGMTMQLVR